jgi:hypothetical protein
MTGTLRIPRSKGAVSGVLLVLLGIWGALIPFVGPYFHYAYTPDRTWDYTTGRLWLEILPGLAALVGGVLMLISRLRPVAMLATGLAAAGGAWFAVGGLLARKWTKIPSAGTPVGATGHMALEQVGFFIGLGVVIVFVAAAAFGRFSVVAARDLAATSASEPVPERSVPARATASSGLARLPKRLRLSAPVVRSKKKAAAGSASEDETESARAGTSAS